MGRRRWRNQHSDLPQMDATANAAAWRVVRAIVNGDAAPRPLERHWYRGLESPVESRSHFPCRGSIIQRAPLMPGSGFGRRFGAGSWRTALSAPPLRPAGSRPSGHGAPSDRRSRSASRTTWSATGAPPPRARPVWVVASVASHEISNRCIWLLEDAARSSPLTADDRAWRDRGRGVRWNADDEGQAGRLRRPWHSTRQKFSA